LTPASKGGRYKTTEQPFAGGLPAVISVQQLALLRRSSFRAAPEKTGGTEILASEEVKADFSLHSD